MRLRVRECLSDCEEVCRVNSQDVKLLSPGLTEGCKPRIRELGDSC